MTQIGPAEQVLLLLRERLQRTKRARAEPSARHGSVGAQARVAALAGLHDLPERSFRRALVRGLLAEQMGDALSADPAFEDVVGQVIGLIEADPTAAALLRRAAGALRGEA